MKGKRKDEKKQVETEEKHQRGRRALTNIAELANRAHNGAQSQNRSKDTRGWERRGNNWGCRGKKREEEDRPPVRRIIKRKITIWCWFGYVTSREKENPKEEKGEGRGARENQERREEKSGHQQASGNLLVFALKSLKKVKIKTVSDEFSKRGAH